MLFQIQITPQRHLRVFIEPELQVEAASLVTKRSKAKKVAAKKSSAKKTQSKKTVAKKVSAAMRTEAQLARAEEKRLKQLTAAFKRSTAEGLLLLGTEWLDYPLSASAAYCRDLAKSCLTALCRESIEATSTTKTDANIPDKQQLQQRYDIAPPMQGSEYLSVDALTLWWTELREQVISLSAEQTVSHFLEQRNPAWQAIGRVTFHLAENKQDDQYPFAFLASYVDQLSADGSVRHIPLAHALQQSATAGSRSLLVALLTPVQRAADQLPWLQDLLSSRDLFKALAWEPEQAYEFLQSVQIMNKCGLSVRTPDWWKKARPRPKVNVSIGNKNYTSLGMHALLDFKVQLTMGDVVMRPSEIRSLMKKAANVQSTLVQMKGQWVEIDSTRLKQALEHWQQIEQDANGGISFAEAMRWMAGADRLSKTDAEQHTAAIGTDTEWVGINPGIKLLDTLAKLRDPASINASAIKGLQATLRPYQQTGVNWLCFMTSLRLGACLADDMGLGKTIQVLALLLSMKQAQKKTRTRKKAKELTIEGGVEGQFLLVVPASLMANWHSELSRFAPSLSVTVLHASFATIDLKNQEAVEQAIEQHDLVITSYTMASRLTALKQCQWRLVVLDEAQAIKNPNTKQTRSIKQLKGLQRIAMTGTPIENNLTDLWSLFDFINPGLLGNTAEFKRFMNKLSSADEPNYAPLRQLVSPYILRRLKTDKRVISDLPDKTEVNVYCGLSREQATLYQASVFALETQLAAAESGIQRSGLVLSFLMRFKQICNHPAQWQGTGDFQVEHSAKFKRLVSLCEELAQRQERILVFTQFREMTQPLAQLLETVFARPGLVLHGGTPIKQRQSMVNQFQQEDGPPFFVLSLKAGGTGLNLTAASHVLHFDRWWNPAVEQQATDRAFRIGQQQHVMVHKFVCQGTIEERIDKLISEKSAVSDAVLSGQGLKSLTDMNNNELLKFVALDINAVY